MTNAADKLTPLLSVEGLSVEFGASRVVDDLSFTVAAGKTVAIVGESGSGKSITSLSTMRLADMMGARFPTGRIMFGAKNLLEVSQKDMRSIRGKDIAMIFQEPMTSLNPVFTIGDQICEVLILHEKMGKTAASAEARRLLDMVRLPDSAALLDRYPHQLSGGMRQRVMIAMALACRPKLLIADEPTTALDVTIQAQILDLMKDLKSKIGAAIILITHDLGIVAEVAERVMVMYAGHKVEEAPVAQLYRSPRHPYTQGLFGAVPKLGSSLDGTTTRLVEIPGVVPSLKERLPGCVFASRCALATDLCRQAAPALELKAAGHFAACHYAPKEALAA